MPRIARVVAAQYPHHVTQRGNNRADVFFDEEDKAFYIKTLKDYSQKYEVKIWAYCLMPNHVHLLVVPAKEASLARCIGRTNLIYTQHINKKYNRSGRLWQNRFFSTIVDEEAYLWAVVRYIELNPVKAGHAEKPEQYQWSSCRASISGRSDALINGHGWLDDSNRSEYKKFLLQQDPVMEEQIRRATSTGRPLGGEYFIKNIENKLARRLFPCRAGRPKIVETN
jgi:putative transposase